VELRDAEIGGTLLCDRAAFENRGGMALGADRASVKGSIFLKNGFSAEGEVRLLGAQVGSNLECDGGSFNNPLGEAALNADRVKVAGGVFFRNGFLAEGAVRLLGAQVGGDVDCSGGTLRNPSGKSLVADNIKVAGNVFLRDAFSAEGAVVLFQAQLGGGLDCRGGTFKNPGSCALNADGIEISGAFFLRDGLSAEGEVRLQGAQIKSNLDCSRGTFMNPTASALTADGITVRGHVEFQNSVSEGVVLLSGAQIGGDFSCEGGRFRSSERALDAANIKVRGGVFLDGVFADGEVRLYEAQVGSSLVCKACRFTNRGGSSFSGQNIDVRGNVVLDGLDAGSVVLSEAQIEGSLRCQHSKISEFQLRTAIIKGSFFWLEMDGVGTRLDLRNASVGSIGDDEKSWPAAGNLFLEGFSYARISAGPIDAMKRLGWLARQDHFALQPYRQLASALRDTGDEVGAHRVLFEMESLWRRARDRTWLARLWSWLLGHTFGYSLMSQSAIVWLCVTFVGFVLSGVGYLGGTFKPTDKEAYAVFEQQNQPPPYYPRFNPLFYSFEYSFPLVNLGVRDHWAPNSAGRRSAPVLQSDVLRAASDLTLKDYYLLRIHAPELLSLWFWFQVPVCWALVTLFAASLTTIVKRDP
jgi:hypothetical protein